ncbi:hypothetical protein GN956_G16170 [Arapaima gigas]
MVYSLCLFLAHGFIRSLEGQLCMYPSLKMTSMAHMPKETVVSVWIPRELCTTRKTMQDGPSPLPDARVNRSMGRTADAWCLPTVVHRATG